MADSQEQGNSLIQAVKDNDVDKVDALIKELNFDVNNVDSFQVCPTTTLAQNQVGVPSSMCELGS